MRGEDSTLRPACDQRAICALCLVTAAAIGLAGCVAETGRFCHRDSDCTPGLRCSGTADQRGVCVYPEALPDAVTRDVRHPAADGLQRDLAPDLDARAETTDAAPEADAGADTAGDTGTDQSPPDAGSDADASPDAETDAAVLDSATQDAADTDTTSGS